MVVNTCTPTNIFGPLEQTLFLGCSVINFTTTIGWNEQPSELLVNIVEDPCAGHTRTFFDRNLAKKTTTNADFGFLGLDRWQDTDGNLYSGDRKAVGDTFIRKTSDIIGAPAYFRVGDFEFSGIIESFRRLESSSTNPAFSVKLVSPIELLKNLRIIIGEYAGSVGPPSSDFIGSAGSPFNIINVFGFMESFAIP